MQSSARGPGDAATRPQAAANCTHRLLRAHTTMHCHHLHLCSCGDQPGRQILHWGLGGLAVTYESDAAGGLPAAAQYYIMRQYHYDDLCGCTDSPVDILISQWVRDQQLPPSRLTSARYCPESWELLRPAPQSRHAGLICGCICTLSIPITRAMSWLHTE